MFHVPCSMLCVPCSMNMFKHLRRSFKDAVSGIIYTFRWELSFRIQLVVAALVLAAVFYFPLTNPERVVIIMLIGLVLILELANSVLERLIDLFRPSIDYIAKSVKDILAGAVLIAALMSVAIGIIVFWPYVKSLIK